MQIMDLDIGDGALTALDIRHLEQGPVTLHDGPIVSVLEISLGTLGEGTHLHGRVWTAGPQVVIRYYEARSPQWGKMPICAVARLGQGQLRKLPGSKPGTAILEFSRAGTWVVDAFR